MAILLVEGSQNVCLVQGGSKMWYIDERKIDIDNLNHHITLEFNTKVGKIKKKINNYWKLIF